MRVSSAVPTHPSSPSCSLDIGSCCHLCALLRTKISVVIRLQNSSSVLSSFKLLLNMRVLSPSSPSFYLISNWGSCGCGFRDPEAAAISDNQCWGSGLRRIRMVLGLPDPDPLVRGTDPDPATDHSLFPLMCWADWNNAWQNRTLTKKFSKKLNFLDWRLCTCGSVMRKKYEKITF